MINRLKHLISLLLLMLTIQVIGQSQRIVAGKINGIENNLYLLNRGEFIPLELKNKKFKIELSKEHFPENITLAIILGKKVKYLSPKIWFVVDSVNVEFDISERGNSYRIDREYTYQDISEKIEYASKQEQYDLIKQNINTYPAIFFLNENIRKYSLDKLKSLYSKIPSDYKTHNLVQQIKGYLKAQKLTSPKLRDKFLSFELKDKNEDLIIIEPSASKYRLFAFVAYGCYFSRASIPTLSELQKKYGNQIDFVTIWDVQSNEIWQDKNISTLITWTDLWDKADFVYNYFDINIFPVFYLIDKDGRIIAIEENYEKLEKMLRKKLR